MKKTYFLSNVGVKRLRSSCLWPVLGHDAPPAHGAWRSSAAAAARARFRSAMATDYRR